MTGKLHYSNHVKVQRIPGTDFSVTSKTRKYKSRASTRLTLVKEVAPLRRKTAMIMMMIVKALEHSKKKRKLMKCRPLLRTMTSTSY